MALALATASQLKPDIRLAQAVSEFEAALATEQKAAFRTARSAAHNVPLTIRDVMRLTAEVDLEASRKHGRVRCFGPRMTNMLQAIQQFAALGDIVIGGSQNLIACGVWAAVRMTVHFATGYLSHLEKLSLLFMAVGRHAPRYQAMAVVYPRSQNLQRYLFEYFIVVVNLCRRALEFTHKSRFSRLTMSMSDPDLGEFEVELETWSSSIKEEVNLLLSQRVEDEARESAKFRALTKTKAESSAHRKKAKALARFLDACSTYNYQQTWKQTRKIGTTRLLLKSLDNYQQWKKTTNYPAALLFGGKLGSGKSVALANMVDDLNLEANRIVVYFFCRYDIPESLEARTIMGCLARQLLEQFASRDSYEDIFVEPTPVLDVDRILEIIMSVLPCDKAFYIIVDGLDECALDEQNTMLRCFDQVQSKATANHKICVSVRSTPENMLRFGTKFQWHASMPEDNGDIKEFVAAEVDHRLQDGRLVTGDRNLVQDIKQALNDGAKGMFLWVSLQLDLICSETTDHSIRESIRSMPRDLTEVYKRVLSKASSTDSKSFNVRVFKFLVAAIHPLTTEQLREAMSVTPGDIVWKRTHQINSIHAVLKFCGSLIHVDEEEDTVSFIHHSAQNFCLRTPGDSCAWLFTAKEAHKEMAETIVTYLSFQIFDSRVSTVTIPTVEAGDIPNKVTQSTMQSLKVAKNITRGLVKLRPSSSRNIGPALVEAMRTNSATVRPAHPLLPYARETWALHTRFFEHLDTYSHWCKLLDDPMFGIDFAVLSLRSNCLNDAQHPSSTPGMWRRIKWALSHSHILLLRHEMTRGRGRRKLQILGTIFTLLQASHRPLRYGTLDYDYDGAMFILPPPRGHRPSPDIVLRMVPQMEHQLRVWLMPFAITFGFKHLRSELFKTMAESDYTMGMLMAAVYSRDIKAATILLRRRVSHPAVLKEMKPLFDVACELYDTRMAYFLAKRGSAINPFHNAMTLSRVFSSAPSTAVQIRFAQIILDAGIRTDNLSENNIYFMITTLLNADIGNRSILDSFIARILEASPHHAPPLDNMLHLACTKGDDAMAGIFLHHGADPNTEKMHESCLDVTLRRCDSQQVRLATVLLNNGAIPSDNTLFQAVSLQLWDLPGRLRDMGCSLSDMTDLVSNQELVYVCAEALDVHGIDFLIQETGMDINEKSSGPEFTGMTVFDVLVSAASRHRSARNRYQLTSLIRLGANINWSRMVQTAPNSLNTALLWLNEAALPERFKQNEILRFGQAVCESSHDLVRIKAPIKEMAIIQARNLLETHFARKSGCYSQQFWSDVAEAEEVLKSGGCKYTPIEGYSFLDTTAMSQELKTWREIEVFPRLRYQYYTAQKLGLLISILLKTPLDRYPTGASDRFQYFVRIIPCLLPEDIPSKLACIAGISVGVSMIHMQFLRIMEYLIRDLGDDGPGGMQILQDSFHLQTIFRLYGGSRASLLGIENKTFPLLLEAALIGHQRSDGLRKLLASGSSVLVVAEWMERMDPSMFSWTMGFNPPLSFTRVFRAFEEAECSPEDMHLLESALETARSRLVELEG